MQYSESPDVTGLWYCKACGNSERFIGIDDEGFPGETDDHDDDCPLANPNTPDTMNAVCTCTTTLSQYFRTDPVPSFEAALARVTAAELLGEQPDFIVYYASHEGGGSGAEIGGYTQVLCACCDEVLWAETPDPSDEGVVAVNQEN